MKKRFAQAILLAAVAFLMGTGCALNNIQYVEQPESATPGSAIEVYVFDAYSILGQDSVLAMDWIRDSVLVAAMLPTGWTVNTAQYYIDNEAYATMQRYGADPSSMDIEHILDSLSGQIVTPRATDAYDSDLTTTYSLGALLPHAFMGADPINVPAGTAMDTVVADTTGMVDSLYMKVIGCYVYFNITTGSVEDTFDLGYFVGFMPDSIGGQNAENAYEDSNVIVIANNSGMEVARERQIRMEITGNPINARSLLSYYVPTDARGAVSLTLSDARGNIIESRQITAQTGWNRQELGSLTRSALQPGVYFLQIAAGNTVTRHRLVVAE